MKRGEVWWADLGAPVGTRPVLLLSRDEAYKVRNAVTVAIITSTIRNIPVEVKLGKSEGMPKECVVNLDTIITIRKHLIKNFITELDAQKIAKVDSAIKFALAVK
ncbi:MAG: type II toxin-antitoxin system PemK/MazF family toxin [bacterium]